MAVQDSVNATPFTNGKEQQLGSGSAKWQQVLYYQAVANVPDGSTITLTPFAAATVTGLSVTVVRYVTGTIANAFVSQGNTANTAQGAPALGAAPTIGQFVMTFDAADSGTLTQAAAFALDSAVVGASCTLANAYATADGVSTFASTWTDTASVVSATMTVAFTFAGVGVPYRVGQLTSAAGSATSVVTVATTTIANDALFVVCGCGGGGVPTANSVADTKSHTYTLAASVIAPNGMCVWIFQSLHAATPLLSSGDTVTVTWSGTTNQKNVEVIACAGVNATAALDQIASAYATGAAPSVTTTASLANNNELVLAAITSGYATASITWAAGITAMDTGLRSAGGVYTSVGTQVITNSTSAPTAGATLGASGVWAELMITLLPDPPTGAAATITITNASPLPPGQVGVAYSTQMAATGGAPPYTWAVTAGAVPPGLTLASGSGGGGSSDFTYIGVNTGPQGSPTLGGFSSQYAALGPLGCYKFFGTVGLGLNGYNWTGSLADQITTWCAQNGKPQPFCYFSWGPALSSAAQLTAFIQSIPHTVKAVGFTFDSEPEATWAPGTGTNGFITAYQGQANIIHGAQANTPVKLYMMTASLTAGYATGGNGLTGGYIPGPSFVDVYGMDFYDRHNFVVGSDMGSTVQWHNWLNLVKGFGKPIGITEFGLSGYGSDAAQTTRLQADIAYLKTAFGPPAGGNPGGTVSQLPLFVWLYWNTASGGINDMLGPNVKATWAGVAATQAGAPAGGGTGGLISGTPTVAGTSTPTIRATDSAAATGSKAFSLVISGSSSLAVATTSLPGGTVGTAYSGGQLAATGGTIPYTWSLNSGTLPPGLAIVDQSITGTPTSNGTSSFVIKVTDNVAATATASLSIIISTGLQITTTSLPPGQVGVSYAFTLSTAGGTPPYLWSAAQGMPAGMILDTAAGIMSGVPELAGSFPETFTVTDGAGASATSVPMTLAVAPVTGGLPPIGRRRFGGTTADWTFQFVGDAIDRAAGVTVTFYNALTGGDQITDLTTAGGGPITSVVSDASGEIPEFFGPANVVEMFADANGGLGPRRRVTAADLGDLTVVMYNALKLLTG
jgi:hypothetical protein